MSALTKLERVTESATSCDRLRALINPGDTVYTIIRSVSSSGLSRTMSVYIAKDSRLVNITYYVAHALDYSLRDVNGSRVMRVGGAGMDMGFHVVYSLGRTLWPRIVGDSTTPQEDPGYSLSHEWA